MRFRIAQVRQVLGRARAHRHRIALHSLQNGSQEGWASVRRAPRARGLGSSQYRRALHSESARSHHSCARTHSSSRSQSGFVGTTGDHRLRTQRGGRFAGGSWIPKEQSSRNDFASLSGIMAEAPIATGFIATPITVTSAADAAYGMDDRAAAREHPCSLSKKSPIGRLRHDLPREEDLYWPIYPARAHWFNSMDQAISFLSNPSRPRAAGCGASSTSR